MTSKSKNYLPIETWDQILSEATYYPGEFDADEWVGGDEFELARRDITSNESTNRFILCNRMKGDIETNFEFQLDTRRSLVLVCRQWYNLTIQHLYGSVTVKSTVLPKLANTFTSNRYLGPLVKRLELKGSAHPNQASEFNCVLSMCPNIVVFCDISRYTGGPMKFWWEFLMSNPTTSAKLRHAVGVDWGIPSKSFLTFVSSLSSLVALKLPQLALVDIHKYTSVSVGLPKLRILDFGREANITYEAIISYISSWELPNLHTVWVPVERRVTPLTEFWRMHGEKLTTIKIYEGSWYGRNSYRISLGDVSLGVESIGQPPSEVFPRLRQLIVLHNAIGYYPLLFLPSLSLEIYEVPFHYVVPKGEPFRSHVLNQIVKYHLDQLPADKKMISDKAPNLRVFRISDCPTKSDNEPLKKIYAEFVEKHLDSIKAKLEARGISLELVELE